MLGQGDRTPHGRKAPRGQGGSSRPALLPASRSGTRLSCLRRKQCCCCGCCQTPGSRLGLRVLHLGRAQKSPCALGRHAGLIHVPGRRQPRSHTCPPATSIHHRPLHRELRHRPGKGDLTQGRSGRLRDRSAAQNPGPAAFRRPWGRTETHAAL